MSRLFTVTTSKTSCLAAVSLLFILLCLGGACSHTHSEHESAGITATIVVERPENNGSVNLVRCAIVLSTGQRAELGGGETATLTVPPGSLWLEVSSFDIYQPDNPDPKAWRSRRMTMHLKPGEVVRLSVEPNSRDSTYVGGWTIERTRRKRSAVGARHALCRHVPRCWPAATHCDSSVPSAP
jgi:hypothetical protein